MKTETPINDSLMKTGGSSLKIQTGRTLEEREFILKTRRSWSFNTLKLETLFIHEACRLSQEEICHSDGGH